MPPGPYRATTCRGRELNYGSHTYFFDHTRTWRASPRMSDQPNAGATSETAQIWKTRHTKHTPSHPNKANMEWRLRGPNDSRGPWGPKVSWHLSDRWGKTPKKLHPGNLSRPGIEPGPAAWQARMLPLAPQLWTINVNHYIKKIVIFARKLLITNSSLLNKIIIPNEKILYKSRYLNKKYPTLRTGALNNCAK